MAEGSFRLTASSPLGGAIVDCGPNVIEERSDHSIYSLSEPVGGARTLAEVIREEFALDPPSPTISTVSDDFRAVKVSPDKTLIIYSGQPSEWDGRLVASSPEMAYVVDQTDAWCVLEMSGPDARAASCRWCSFDLSTDVFQINAAACTAIDHLPAVLIRTGGDRFLLLTPRSSAKSVLATLEMSFRNAMLYR